MRKMSFRSVAVVLLALAVFVATPQLALSSTIVTVQPGGTFINIESFNFSISGPSGTTASNFTASLPADWFNLSSGPVISALSLGSFLPTGAIGSFNVDNVVLSGWVFGHLVNGNAVSFTQGIDYFVSQVGGNYVVSGSAVPIPAAVWLLGSGLVGLIGLRRRMKK
jgi:hypothetical protein